MRFLRTAMVFSVLAVISAPAQAGNFEKLLPEDTIVFFSLNDLSQLEARVKESPLYAFYQEKEVQAFLEIPRKAWADAMKEARGKAGGVSPEDMLAIAKGQVALAVTGLRKLDGDRSILGFVVMVDVGDNEAKLKELIARMDESRDADKKVRRVEESFRGTTIITYLKGDLEDGLTPMGDGIFMGSPCYFIKGGMIALAGDAEIPKGILARQDGTDAPSLSGNATFRSIKTQTGARADMTLYVNATPIWEIVKEQTKDNPMVTTVMEALEVFNIRGFGFGMEFGRDAMTSRMFIDSPGEKLGLMRFFAAKNSPLLPPKFVPMGAGTVGTMAFDVVDLWKETRRIIGKIDPSMLEQLDAFLEGLKEQLGVDVEKDIIGSFGKHMTYYQLFPDKTDGGGGGMFGAGTNMVLAFAVTDAETLGGAIDTILETFPIPLEDQEYLGVKMRVLKLGGMSPSMAIVGGHLVIAFHQEDLQAVIRSSGKEVKGLIDSPDFARAMSRLPAERIGLNYADPRKSYKMLREFLPSFPFFGPDVADWVDFSLMPSSALFDKYFDVGGGVVLNTESGVLILSRSQFLIPK